MGIIKDTCSVTTRIKADDTLGARSDRDVLFCFSVIICSLFTSRQKLNYQKAISGENEKENFRPCLVKGSDKLERIGKMRCKKRCGCVEHSGKFFSLLGKLGSLPCSSCGERNVQSRQLLADTLWLKELQTLQHNLVPHDLMERHPPGQKSPPPPTNTHRLLPLNFL